MKHLILIIIVAMLLSGCADSAEELPQAEAPQPKETFFGSLRWITMILNGRSRSY